MIENMTFKEVKIPASFEQRIGHVCTSCLCVPRCRNKHWITIIRTCPRVLIDIKDIFMSLDNKPKPLNQKDEAVVVYVKGIDMLIIVEEDTSVNYGQMKRQGLCFGGLGSEAKRHLQDFIKDRDGHNRSTDYVFFRGWFLKFNRTLWIEFETKVEQDE